MGPISVFATPQRIYRIIVGYGGTRDYPKRIKLKEPLSLLNSLVERSAIS